MAGRPITEQHDTEDADTYPMLSEAFPATARPL